MLKNYNYCYAANIKKTAECKPQILQKIAECKPQNLGKAVFNPQILLYVKRKTLYLRLKTKHLPKNDTSSITRSV